MNDAGLTHPSETTLKFWFGACSLAPCVILILGALQLAEWRASIVLRWVYLVGSLLLIPVAVVALYCFSNPTRNESLIALYYLVSSAYNAAAFLIAIGLIHLVYFRGPLAISTKAK